MRTINISVDVYQYSELTPDAKEKAKDKIFNILREDHEPFIELITNYLETLGFYDVDIHYSLTYSQGDGFCFEGKIDYKDLIRNKEISDKLSVFSEDFLKSCDDCLDTIHFVKMSNRYSHCNTICAMITNNEWMNIEDYERLHDIISRYYKSICSKCESRGYKYFYEIDEDEIIEYCNANDIEFYSDGRIFG